MKTPTFASTSYLLLAPLAVLLLVFALPSLRPSSRAGSDGLGALCARRAGFVDVAAAAADPHPPAAEAALQPNTRPDDTPPPPELSLLVGVLTVPGRRERRDIVRTAYALQPRAPRARVDVRFVFCRVTDPVDAALVALEIRRHGDIVVLDTCAESMNDDTYLRVAALVEELRGRPREDVYLGRGYAMGGQPMPFMHGMGYVVSWDVAAWVGGAGAGEIMARNDTVGPEDLMVGKWLNLAGRGRNRYDLKPRMYDLSWDMDNFRPDTVAVHMLKDNRRWAAAFAYFNVTAGIDLRHLP